jgi:Tol biopolymer transport system component
MMLTIVVALPAQNSDGEVMLQRAIRKESVEGDLKGAIELYKKIVAGAAKNRAAAAKALLRLGECYEQQGDAEAQRAYERLVREFGDQKEQVHDAELRLSAMGGSTSGSKAISAQLIGKGAPRFFGGRVTRDGALYPYVDPATGDVVVRDLRTGAVRRLTNEGTMGKPNGAHGESPLPSRDGRQIAFLWHPASGPDELRVSNMGGGGMRRVAVKSAGFNLYDWSPDGKNVLADVDGIDPTWWDLATIDVATGEVRRIGQSTGWGDFEVAGFSSDGRWAVYSREVRGKVDDWDIYAMEIQTGRETVVVSGAGRDRFPVWVPDTDEIVFRSDRSGTNGIWMVRFKEGQAASEPALIKDAVADFNPDGVSRDGSFFYTIRHDSRDLYQAIVDPQTLRARQAPVRVLDTYLGHNWAPSWAPSGDSFAYYSEREAGNAWRLVIRHPDGTEAVASELIRADQLRWNDFPAQWCGNDRLLTLGTVDREGAMLFDSQSAAKLSEHVSLKGLGSNSWAMVTHSGDCRSFYFRSNAPHPGIYKFDSTTGAKSNVLTDAPNWSGLLLSPDGRWLAVYGKLEGGTREGILVASTAGGAVRMLDADGVGRNYSWTPDSKRLLSIHKADGGENELFYTSVEGGTPQPTGIRMKGLSHPSLNADGTKLLFGSATTENEFWAMRNLPLGAVAKSR